MRTWCAASGSRCNEDFIRPSVGEADQCPKRRTCESRYRSWPLEFVGQYPPARLCSVVFIFAQINQQHRDKTEFAALLFMHTAPAIWLNPRTGQHSPWNHLQTGRFMRVCWEPLNTLGKDAQAPRHLRHCQNRTKSTP